MAIDLQLLQRVLDEQGYLIVDSFLPRRVCDVLRAEKCKADCDPFDAVVIGAASYKEAREQAKQYFGASDAELDEERKKETFTPYYYKVIVE